MGEIGLNTVTLEQSDYDEFEELLDDFPAFAAEFLLIKSEEGGELIPFKLNELQLSVWDQIKEDVYKKKLVRLMILKCRQTGISTLFEAIDFWISLRERNQKFLILGHEKDASLNLFNIYQRYMDNVPPWMQPAIRTNQKEKKVEYANGTEVIIQTAGQNVDTQKAGTGRSSTYQYIHATECAFYPDYLTTFVGLLQASKKAWMIVLETTANGFNSFRNDWEDAKNGLTDYTTIFLSWLDFKTYTRPFATDEEKQTLLHDLGHNSRYNEYKNEERNLIKNHNATLEQLNWRRWAINNLCKGNIDKFHQEYPTTDKEAFISSGRPVFNQSIVIDKFENCMEPLKVGDLVYKRDADQKIIGVEFVENSGGYINLYEEPRHAKKEHYIYCAGCDVAEGLAQGDYSYIKVMDRRTRNVVLSWHGHIAPDLLAYEQHKIHLFLDGQIYFCTELNNHGLTTVTTAFNLGVNQYYRQDWGTGFEHQKSDLGFKTSEVTKRFIIDHLEAQIREEEFSSNDREFWSECMTFVRNERGQMQAQDKDKDKSVKCYDDRVIGAALMLRCDLWMGGYYVDKDPEPYRVKDLLIDELTDEATY